MRRLPDRTRPASEGPGRQELLEARLRLHEARLPAILSEQEAASLLGVNVELMRELCRLRLVECLGEHADQAPKRYAAAHVLRLCADEARLRQIDEAQVSYWRRKNAGRRKPPALPAAPGATAPMVNGE